MDVYKFTALNTAPVAADLIASRSMPHPVPVVEPTLDDGVPRSTSTRFDGRATLE